MQLLLTIRDSGFSLNSSPTPSQWKERRASRAVVFDKDRKIALLHVTKREYHKLPGGGIEDEENVEEALRREVQEEIGCDIGNIRELGSIEEYRGMHSLHQISYCFIADLVGEKGTPHLEQGEIEDGFETMWLDLNTAISTLEADAPVEDYQGNFIQQRDLAFLKAALGE